MNHPDVLPYSEGTPRYPLLEELLIRGHPTHASQPLPRFLRLLMAAAESSAPEICCVLLPEIETVGYLIAMLLALSRLQAEFPALLSEYARRGLQVGQRVRVLPLGYVYRYAGVLPGYDESFKLEVLDAGDKSWKTFPVAQILRLEPTEHARPKGKGHTSLGSFELSPLDRLIGIQSGGNTSLFRNQVLYLSARIEAQDLATGIMLTRATDDPARGVVGEAVPWGHITADGVIQRDDDYQRDGEPLIAVTHSPDHLAEACERAPALSKLVIANEADKLARNLQAYDRIARTQKLLVIAGHRSVDAVQPLGDRGCRVWRLSPSDFLHGEIATERRADTGTLGRLFRAVDNWQRLGLQSVDCEDTRLDTIAEHLESAGRLLDPEVTREETKRIVGRLFALLCSASEPTDEIDEDAIREVSDQLDAVSRAVGQEAVWLPREATLALKAACEGLRSAYSSTSYANGKGAALHTLIRELEGRGLSRVLVVTRTPASASAMTKTLKDSRKLALSIRPINEVDDFPEADVVVVTAWPNSRRFGELISRYLAPSLYLIAYRFERRWFMGFQRQRAARMRRGEIAPAIKAFLTGLPVESFPPMPAAATSGENQSIVPQRSEEMEVSDISGIVRIEDLLLHQRKGASLSVGARDDTRPARYVGFFGAAYAYLSEWQHVPVITELVRRKSEGRARVSLRTVDALTTGDYVVFRAGAESNLIRTMAEQLAGPGEYARWRQRADRWRKGLQIAFTAATMIQNMRARGRSLTDIESTLRETGLPASKDGLMSTENALERVHTLLWRWGLKVGPHTVRRWLNDENQIGPADESNLVAIAKATEDDDLLACANEVWEAIRALRTLHLDAGRRLTQLVLAGIQQTLPQVGSKETKIEVGGTPAWILQVEEIGEEYEERPSNHLNRLLWDEAVR